LLPQIYHAITGLKGCEVASDRQSFLFPRSKLEVVSACLEQIGRVERVPDWVMQLLTVQQQKGDCIIQDRVPDRLLPYQREGVDFGLGVNGRCLIGDEMGLGKTLQALTLAAQYAEEWPVLVLCPSSLRWVWKEQVEEWLPQFAEGDEIQVIKKGSDQLRPDAHIWIISYSMLASNAKSQGSSFQQRPDGTPHGIVIADESHNLKEWGAERTKAAVPVLRKAKRAILLSGTPTRNSPDELHPQLCSLLPLKAKLAEFRSRYCMQQQSMIFGGRMVNQVVGARNSTELNHLLTTTVMIRRLKKDVMQELTPKRRQKVPLEVADAKDMKESRNQMHNIQDSWFVGESGPSEAISSLFMKTAKAKLPAVKEYLIEVLERGDEKAIIFAHHQVMMDEISSLLEKQLAKSGLYHIRIDGKTGAAKRPELVKQFQTDPRCRIALLSITACGEGLTLSAAGLVIFAELYWVPGAVEQAEARAHRIGNTQNKVIVEFLVVPNSPDERIYSCLERKKKDTSKLLDGAEESLGALERLSRKRAIALAEERKQSTLSFGESKRPRTAAAASPSANSTVAKRAPAKIATPQRSGETAGRNDGKAASASKKLETPPPVERWKIDFLLRAAKG
jgi:SNF2 family DNA or RNA helicase